MNTELIKLSAACGRDIYDMLQSIPADENGLMNDARGLSYDEYKAWLEKRYAESLKTEIYDGFKVPQTFFFFYVDSCPVGLVKIRHFLTDRLRQDGGNMGYAIRPEARGKGYGKLMLSAALKECAKLGIDKALVTIHEGNTASVKMALANGGIMEKRENGNLFIWMDCHSNRGNIFYDTSDLSDGEIMLRVSRMTDAIPEKKFVPAYKFDICLMNGMAIGVCDLRIGHTEGLYIGGNIGYGIDENYRGRHYAAKACKLLFRLAQKHNLGHVFITCVPDNTASCKTMEYAGCRYVGMAMIHEDDEMYKEGKRLVKIYRKDLD